MFRAHAVEYVTAVCWKLDPLSHLGYFCCRTVRVHGVYCLVAASSILATLCLLGGFSIYTFHCVYPLHLCLCQQDTQKMIICVCIYVIFMSSRTTLYSSFCSLWLQLAPWNGEIHFIVPLWGLDITYLIQFLLPRQASYHGTTKYKLTGQIRMVGHLTLTSLESPLLLDCFSGNHCLCHLLHV